MRLIACIVMTVAAAILFPVIGMAEGSHLPRQGTKASCFEREPGGSPSFLGTEVSVVYKSSDLGDVVGDLQGRYKLPISYIEQPGNKLISLAVDKVTVAAFLQAVLAKSPGYVCQVIDGHVVIYPNSPEFRSLVRGVEIVDRPRAIAARAYLKFASGQVDYFKKVDIILGGILEMPLFEERVSLSPRATVIEHLTQILGGDKSVFFVIRRAPPSGFLFSLGSV